MKFTLHLYSVIWVFCTSYA